MRKKNIFLDFPLLNVYRLNYSIEATGKKNLKTVLSHFIYLLIFKDAHSPVTPDFCLPSVQVELKDDVVFLKE